MNSNLLILFLYHLIFLWICLGNNVAQSNSNSIFSEETTNERSAYEYDTIYDDESLYDSVIYEYDIIYVAPDTIKLIDTIVQFTDPLLQIIPSKQINEIDGPNIDEPGVAMEIPPLPEYLNNTISKWELGIYVTPYISGMFKQELDFDSISTAKSINYKTDLSWHYHGRNVITTLSLGYESVHEQLHYKNSYFTTSPDISGVYDSLLIKSNWTINNYYDYFNISFGLGKEWGKNKLLFFFHGYFTIGLLTGNKKFLPDDDETKTQLQVESINETLFSVSIQQGIAYRINKKINWNLSPYYRFHIYETEIHPTGNLHTIGLTTGFSLFL